MKTKQLNSWEGAFGDAYIERNPCTDDLLRKRVMAFSRIFQPIEMTMPKSMLEIGANIGINIRALQKLTDADLYALEPNPHARGILINDNILSANNVYGGSAEELPLENGCIDMVFTCTVLIHIPPETLQQVCHEIYRVARRYVLIMEYFSPSSERVPYRDHDDMLFKRDYGAIMLDLFSDLELLDYGFFWKRVTGLDNVNYWLLKKT